MPIDSEALDELNAKIAELEKELSALKSENNYLTEQIAINADELLELKQENEQLRLSLESLKKQSPPDPEIQMWPSIFY